MSGTAGRRAQPVGYEEDLGRFLTNQKATRLFAAEGDLHEFVAERLAQAVPRGRALDMGGGNGLWARSRMGDAGRHKPPLDPDLERR